MSPAAKFHPTTSTGRYKGHKAYGSLSVSEPKWFFDHEIKSKGHISRERCKVTQSSIEELETLLARLLELPRWTKEKHDLKRNIQEIASRLEFYHFKSRADFFPLSRLPHIGETAIFAVPKDHKGKLKSFSGKTVKIICIDNAGQYDREMVAYEVHGNQSDHSRL